MDIATIIGIILGLGSIGTGIFLAASSAGAEMGVFLSTSSFAIVFGGMLASVSVAFPLKEVLQLKTAMAAVFKGSKRTLAAVIEEAVSVAEIARKGGTIELEKNLGNINDPFFRDGVEMVATGYSLEELSDVMNTSIDYREIRERSQAELFKTMGTMAPAWGMIGTLIGLVIMLAGFGSGGSGMAALGAGMSAALITTFYGAVFANLFFLPMAAKLSSRIAFTSTIQAMLVEASRLVQQKKHPLIVREKLNAFIPPKERVRSE